jgi:hypothetical protein
MKTLVFDDLPSRKEHIVAELSRAGVTGTAIDEDAFPDACAALARREKEWRDRATYDTRDDAALFDSADVVILDFNLAEAALTKKGLSGTSGAEIATRLRLFSNAGVIVNLNRWGTEREFRLEMTVPDTYADLDIASCEVGDRAVWYGPRNAEFAPTYRRPISTLLKQLPEREREVEQAWDQTVATFFGFDEGEWEGLPRAVRAMIGRRDAASVTIDQFVRESGYGLRVGDVTEANAGARPPHAARLAASRLGAWLEMRVALLDDPLIGIGLLATFLPTTLSPSDGNWNRLAWDDLATQPEMAPVEKYRFTRVNWSTRALWWWPRLARDMKFAENAEPWAVEAPPVVFASDSSSFIARGSARPFRSDLELNSDRFVGDLSGVQYLPDDYLMRG